MFLLYIDATSVSNTKGTVFHSPDLRDLFIGQVTEELLSLKSLGQLSKSGSEGPREALEDRCGGEEYSLKELYAVQEIQSQPDLFRLIVQ